MKITLLTLLMLLSGTAQFDKTVHDFGKILLKDGPQSCSFTLSNDSQEDVSILAVTTSCGCTSVKWTREAIKPGCIGTVDATFSNDEGPYPFDKTITVYLSSNKKPVVLHMKGTASKK